MDPLVPECIPECELERVPHGLRVGVPIRPGHEPALREIVDEERSGSFRLGLSGVRADDFQVDPDSQTDQRVPGTPTGVRSAGHRVRAETVGQLLH